MKNEVDTKSEENLNISTSKKNENTLTEEDLENNSQKTNIIKETDKKEEKYWLHKISFEILPKLDKERILGATSKRAKLINDINPNDKILLFTNRTNLEFFGFTQVDEISYDEKPLYKRYYNSKRKLKLKGIKYFSKPIPSKEIINELDFMKELKTPSWRFEYKEVSKEDFFKIMECAIGVVKVFPTYLEEKNFYMDEFILDTIQYVFDLLSVVSDEKQIHIKKFIKILRKALSEYEINKSLEELEEFYSLNIHKLKIKHVPSRDPNNLVPLYTNSGGKHYYGFIVLNRSE